MPSSLPVVLAQGGMDSLWLGFHLGGLAVWFLIVLLIPLREALALRAEDLKRARRVFHGNWRLEAFGMVPALLLMTLSGGLLLVGTHAEQGSFFIVELLVTVGVLVIVTAVVMPATKEMWRATEEAKDFEDARETLVKLRLKELAFGFVPVVGTVYLTIARSLL